MNNTDYDFSQLEKERATGRYIYFRYIVKREINVVGTFYNAERGTSQREVNYTIPQGERFCGSVYSADGKTITGIVPCYTGYMYLTLDSADLERMN